MQYGCNITKCYVYYNSILLCINYHTYHIPYLPYTYNSMYQIPVAIFYQQDALMYSCFSAERLHSLTHYLSTQKRARRFKNQILCDLHFADVALMECSDFMQQLRSFKPQSLGCAVARRKSSTTLIFPLPPQACSGNILFIL